MYDQPLLDRDAMNERVVLTVVWSSIQPYLRTLVHFGADAPSRAQVKATLADAYICDEPSAPEPSPAALPGRLHQERCRSSADAPASASAALAFAHVAGASQRRLLRRRWQGPLGRSCRWCRLEPTKAILMSLTTT